MQIKIFLRCFVERKRKIQVADQPVPPLVIVALREAGWTPTRAVATSLFEDAYSAEGLKLLPKSKKFLRQFGGLIIKYKMPNQRQDVLEFLAERAVQGMSGGGISCFEELTGVAPLCPIGHFLFGTCMLLMDRQGRVFGGSDTGVSLVGESGMQAICAILTGSEMEILEPRAG
jgi:hypothetical protein